MRAPAFVQDLHSVAERAISGESFRHAVHEFLDEFALRPRDLKADALVRAPTPTGDARHDAYLGALAEHLAIKEGLDRPDWCCRPDRFLDSFWFVSPTPGFRAIAIAQAPAAFRRRGIFVPARSLQRV